MFTVLTCDYDSSVVINTHTVYLLLRKKMSTLADCRQTVGANVGSPCLHAVRFELPWNAGTPYTVFVSIYFVDGTWLLLMVEWRLDKGSTPR